MDGPDQIHPLLASRWSPTAFDDSDVIKPQAVAGLLEAARWAPSAGNSQPWAFIVSLRGDDNHQRMARHLALSTARWAPAASLLIANLSHLRVEGTDWEYSEFARYDLGQALAHLTFQARSIGYYVRQFRAFDRAGLEDEFQVADHWEITTMAAIGRLAPTAQPGERIRRPLDDLRWTQ